MASLDLQLRDIIMSLRDTMAALPQQIMVCDYCTTTCLAIVLGVLVLLKWLRRPPHWDPENKVILITGASAGIGKELALQAAKAGAILVLMARREALLKELSKACTQAGSPKAVPVVCDVTDRKACAKAVKTAVGKVGAFDVVVLNAGQSQGCYFEDIEDIDDAQFLMDLNVMGCVNILHYALPSLAKRATSRVVFVSSVAGLIGVPLRTMYCASKWAVVGLANALRIELADAHGTNAPKVVVTCPPEVKSDLNTGRLTFGAGHPAESLPSAQMETAPAVAHLLAGIGAAPRLQHFNAKSSVLAPLYGFLPGLIDGMVLKMIKKTHDMKGQGRG